MPLPKRNYYKEKSHSPVRLMIEDEIKRIREAENSALRRIQEAEKRSKEQIEEGKRSILKEIGEKRKKLLEEIERWKKSADAEGKMEGEKIFEEYKKKADSIKKISEAQIKDVAREVILEIFG